MGQKKRQRTAQLQANKVYAATREDIVNAVEANDFKKMLTQGVIVATTDPQRTREGAYTPRPDVEPENTSYGHIIYD